MTGGGKLLYVSCVALAQLPMAPSSWRQQEAESDAEMATRWWSDYKTDFTKHAHAQSTLANFVSDAYSRPRSLVRSASATNLTYIREFDPSTMPKPYLKRSPSVSSLSPSHRLSYRDRVPTRYISSSVIQPTESDRWYSHAYGPRQFESTLRETHSSYGMQRPFGYGIYTPYTPYIYNLVTTPSKLTPPTMQSYLRGTQDYYNKYVSHRLRMNDFSLPMTYSSYESRKPSTDRFDRHLMRSSHAFVSIPSGSPRYYTGAASASRSRRLNNRYLYF